MLPILAALGGMIVPSIIHLAFNYGTSSQNGFGIPMATDIAFSLAILSLLGNKVPVSLKIFLTALAIIDDLGAIIVIALFYSKSLSLAYLGLASLLFLIMLILGWAKLYKTWVYLILGSVMWFFMYRSGIHPTITGVLLAFAIPFGQWKGALTLACFTTPLTQTCCIYNTSPLCARKHSHFNPLFHPYRAHNIE